MLYIWTSFEIYQRFLVSAFCPCLQVTVPKTLEFALQMLGHTLAESRKPASMSPNEAISISLCRERIATRTKDTMKWQRRQR